MKKIDPTATAVFSYLLLSLGPYPKVLLETKGFPPLTVERLPEHADTPGGLATVYRVAISLPGASSGEPEMRFLVADYREGLAETTGLHVYPFSLRQDSGMTDEESLRIEHDRIAWLRKSIQAKHAKFANQWLRIIGQLRYTP